MSARDRLEVAIRNEVNRYARVPRWRAAARDALTSLPEDVPWREGLKQWVQGRDDPPLARARERIEAQRRAMLRETTSVHDGETALTDIANACNKMSSPRQLGELLYWLVKTSGAATVLELGTALGFSAAYLAAALPADGVVTTIERRPVLAERAREMFAAVGLADRVHSEIGRFFKIADGRLGGQVFDAMFKDGSHDRKSTEEFFNVWAPRCTPGAMVIFDDINHQRARGQDEKTGMDRAWATISGSPRIAHAVDLGRVGVVALRP